MANMLFRDFQIKAGAVDAEERTVEGYASTWDMDQVGDVISPGAFQKSIRERFAAGKIKVLWQHSDAIGIPLEMREDETGLYVKARISQTALGDEALTLARDGVVDRFSIGFMIPKGKAEYEEDGTRRINEVKLMEFSLVTFAANEAAVLTAVKALRQSPAAVIEQFPAALAAATKGTQPTEGQPHEAGDTQTGEPVEGNTDGAPSVDTVEGDGAGESHSDAQGGDDGEGLKSLDHSLEELRNFARLRLY